MPLQSIELLHLALKATEAEKSERERECLCQLSSFLFEKLLTLDKTEPDTGAAH